jgi:hypothetical protein
MVVSTRIVRAICLLALPATSVGQTSTPPTSQLVKEGTAAVSRDDTASASPGFAIESEMLTYTAMQSDSKAIACDLAQYTGLADTSCSPKVGVDPQPGVIVIPSQSAIFGDFQLWVSDMAAMDVLLDQAALVCPGQQESGRTTLGGASAASPLAMLTPAGQALSLAQALLATNESSSPVGGNIGDQALVDGISRQLRSYGFAVLAPDLYMPYSLSRVDPAQSPFLARVNALAVARSNCAPAAVSVSDAKQATYQAIGDFLNTLTGIGNSRQGQSGSPSAVSSNATGAQERNAGAGNSGPTSDPVTVPHLVSVLRADGLARALLGNLTDLGQAGHSDPQPAPFQHLLWIKALESGGAVNKSGNAFFGSKISFSGGAVVTYSLFNLDGHLECSGTLYDYEGSLRPKEIREMLQSQNQAHLLPAKSIGGCTPQQ